MNDNNIKISGDLNWSFDRMAREIPEIEETALRVGAYTLQQEVKKRLLSKMSTASNPVRQQTGKNGYKITSQEPLVDAIRQTKTENGKVKVHALGSGSSGSTTFITRFYEEVTKQRYNKSYKGKKLKTRRYTGIVGGLHFFNDTINAYMGKTTQIISDIINNKLNLIMNE